MMNAGVEEASRNFEALVIGNDAPAFSAGANLMLLLLEAQEENWDEIDLMVRTFQSAVLGLRGDARVPVVVAPRGAGPSEVVARSCCTGTECRPRPRPTWARWKQAPA